MSKVVSKVGKWLLLPFLAVAFVVVSAGMVYVSPSEVTLRSEDYWSGTLEYERAGGAHFQRRAEDTMVGVPLSSLFYAPYGTHVDGVTDLPTLSTSWNDNHLQSSHDDEGLWVYLNRVLIDFDTSDLLPGDEIVSGRLKLYLWFKNAVVYPPMATHITKFTGVKDGVYSSDDWGEWEFTQNWSEILGWLSYGEAVAEAWNTIELTPAGIEAINKGGRTAFWIRISQESAGNDWYVWREGGGYTRYWWYLAGSNISVLELDVVGAPRERVVDENENAVVGGEGDLVTGISWMVPRLAWDDEKAGFRVEGDAGTALNLRLKDGSGVVLSQIDDSIREDGFFYWYPELSGYTGRFRLVEELSSFVGTWGYSQRFTNAGSCRSFASVLQDEDASWSADVASYIVKPNEMKSYYWLTNMTDGEMSTTDIDIWQGGGQRQELYDGGTALSMVQGYMECEDADNYNLISSRHLLVAMDGVADDWDGLILDLNNPLVAMAKGFYWLKVDEAVQGFIKPVSALWYCDAGEISITITGRGFEAGEEIPVTIRSTAELNLQNNLRDLKVSSYKGGMEVSEETGILTSGQHIIQIEGSANLDYVELLMSGVGEDYIHHSRWGIDVTQGEEGVGEDGDGVLPWALPDWLDTAPMKWLMMLVAIAVVAMVFWHHKIVVSVLTLGIIGFGIIIEWVDIWLVVLLALGAGFWVWKAIKGKGEGG